MRADVGAFAAPPRDGGYEAILFVHGFNCSIEGALRLLGQLVALGGFPGNIMPVVFGWPCTVSVFYPQARPLAPFTPDTDPVHVFEVLPFPLRPLRPPPTASCIHRPDSTVPADRGVVRAAWVDCAAGAARWRAGVGHVLHCMHADYIGYALESSRRLHQPSQHAQRHPHPAHPTNITQ